MIDLRQRTIFMKLQGIHSPAAAMTVKLRLFRNFIDDIDDILLVINAESSCLDLPHEGADFTEYLPIYFKDGQTEAIFPRPESPSAHNRISFHLLHPMYSFFIPAVLLFLLFCRISQRKQTKCLHMFGHTDDLLYSFHPQL